MTGIGRLYSYTIIPESGHTLSRNSNSVRPAFPALNLGLLRDLQRVIDLDTKVSDGTLQLGMP
jgi:hypothetical protein